jgi:hypothetical protein
VVAGDKDLRRKLTLAKQHAATAERLVVRQRETIAGLRPDAPSAAAARRLLRLLEELHELTLASRRQVNAALRRSRR